jgi:hypothetical protein
MAKKLVILIFISLFLNMAIFAGDITVLYKCNKVSAGTDTINLFVQIVNNSSSSLSMQNLELRYFYTKEGTSNELCQVNYAQIGCSNVLVACNSEYIAVTFTPGAGKIPAGWDSGIIELAISKSDRSFYNQANDYSFDPKKTDFVENEKICLYKNGTLIYGKEPPQLKGNGTTTPFPTITGVKK